MDFTSLLSQGVACIVLAWFMIRLEKILTELGRQMALNTRATTLLVTNAPAASAAVKREAEALAKEANGGKS